MDNQFYNIGIESQALAPIIETFVKVLKHGLIEESIALTAPYMHDGSVKP